MSEGRDTIAAISTAPGEGGIAIVRVSGPRAGEILAAAFRPAREGAKMRSHMLRYGLAVDGNGAAIDEVMAVFMQAPNTYTREDVAEIHCHGGGVCAAAVLRRALELGARSAEPGEFTRRAYESGRIDLSGAEAVMQLVGAQGEAARRAALRQMRGGVSAFVGDAIAQLTDILSRIQAAVDFPEEVDEEAVSVEIRGEIDEIAARIERRIDPRRARILREGASVVLAGRPNVGKSSLMNALLNCERAIVTDIPGTTRDVLSERFELDGRVVRLSDTAGIRESEDSIERIGVQRAQSEVEGADVVLLVLDRSQPLTEADKELLSLADERYILCLNKADLPCRLEAGLPNAIPAFSLSARTGEGMEALTASLQERLGATAYEDECFTVERQARLAREAADTLRGCAQALQDGFSPDVISPELLNVCNLLDNVTGRDASEEVISAIFANFCVGK